MTNTQNYTQDDIRDLVGRTFKRDGLARTVTRIETAGGGSNVYWKRPGGDERKVAQWWPYFREWLAGAEEIK